MSTDSTLVDYYAQRAGEYERIYHKPERQNDLQRLKELIRQVIKGEWSVTGLQEAIGDI